MSLKNLFVVGIAFAIGALFAYYLSGNSDDNEQHNLSGQTQATYPPEYNESPDSKLPESSSPSFYIGQTPSSNDQTSVAEQPGLANDFNFSSPEHLNATFINANGSISNRAMGQALRFDDFDDFVQRVREAGSSRESTEREMALLNQLTDVFGSAIYQSDHACSGEVCAVVFRSTNELNDTDFNQLGRFADNHPFMIISINEYGDTEFRGIYIHTDTPGEMTLAP